ncbi:MAG: TolC family protein, partial [Verrucomicrobiota bacterium]
LARSAVTRDEAALANARAALAAHWGGEAADIGALTGSLSVPDTLPEAPALLAGLADHPRLASRRAEIEGRRAGLRLEQARAAGDITVGAGVRFFRDGRDAALVAGFSVPLPVRDPNRGNIRAARETLNGAEQLARADEIDLRLEFGAAWRELQAARDTALDLRRHALPAAVRAHELLSRAHAQGEAALFEVLDARRALASVRRELVDAEAACAAALVRVDALTDPSFPLTNQSLSRR